MEFRDILKKLRASRSLTQKELATQLNVTDALISGYESGTAKPSYEMLEKLADFFSVTTDSLMGRDAGEVTSDNYYVNREAAKMAQELYERPEIKLLFDASRDVTKEDIQFVSVMLEKLKKDGDPDVR